MVVGQEAADRLETQMIDIFHHDLINPFIRINQDEEIIDEELQSELEPEASNNPNPAQENNTQENPNNVNR